MATADITTHAPRASFLHLIGAPFRALGRFFIAIAEQNARLQQVERLQAKSDDELAKLGLKRDDIVRHVFRDLYYV